MLSPLKGIRVLDFSTLLPGPMATLLLAEAGAEVIKIEQPLCGDAMRQYPPLLGHGSNAVGANFALLNRGKRSLSLDLKSPSVIERLLHLVKTTDVVMEQFRPGVMRRLGLDYATLSALNPGLIYCSITGYGQTGENAQRAGHDLNYMAQSGLLHLAADKSGNSVIPPVLTADIAGGAYPSVMNILMALRNRDASGLGCHLDISMTDNLLPLAFWGLASGFATDHWPIPGKEDFTGLSPRYQIYTTADNRFLTVAALENKFWQQFCNMIDLPAAFRNDRQNPDLTQKKVAECIVLRPASYWRSVINNNDVCCAIVDSLQEAVGHYKRSVAKIFDKTVKVQATQSHSIPALPLPLASALTTSASDLASPVLGEANTEFGFDDAVV